VDLGEEALQQGTAHVEHRGGDAAALVVGTPADAGAVDERVVGPIQHRLERGGLLPEPGQQPGEVSRGVRELLARLLARGQQVPAQP
jgi:hypothetical protein